VQRPKSVGRPLGSSAISFSRQANTRDWQRSNDQDRISDSDPRLFAQIELCAVVESLPEIGGSIVSPIEATGREGMFSRRTR
jgi:hypothetical protein